LTSFFVDQPSSVILTTMRLWKLKTFWKFFNPYLPYQMTNAMASMLDEGWKSSFPRHKKLREESAVVNKNEHQFRPLNHLKITRKKHLTKYSEASTITSFSI